MKFTSMIPTRSGSGSSSSRYGSTKSSGYGSGSSSGYGGSSGYGSYGSSSTSNYDSGYNSRSSGYGSSGIGSNYGSNYTSPYSASNYSSGSSYTSSGYGRSSGRDYDTGNGNANNSYGSGASSGYSSRTSRDRSSERSLDNLYTPRNARRSLSAKEGSTGIPQYQMNRHRTGLLKREPKRQTQEEPSELPTFRKGLLKRSGSTSDYFTRSGLRKSSSYSGFHWIHQQAARDNEEKKHKAVNVNDMIYKSHRRQGSNSSNNSDVFEEPKSGISRSRESSLRSKPPKRDLEAILGKEDHKLVQRIIEENKAIMEETQAKLTQQEEKLIKKIMEASMTGNPLECLDVLTIIESC